MMKKSYFNINWMLIRKVMLIRNRKRILETGPVNYQSFFSFKAVSCFRIHLHLLLHPSSLKIGSSLPYPHRNKKQVQPKLDSFLKLALANFYQIFIFHQMIALSKLWKMFFISSKKLFSFSSYSNFCISVFPSFFPC